jgi:molybdenum cofactor cytidylyltransferase
VLAAGGSRRMGEPKQLLRWRGRTLVEHIVVEARESSSDAVFVVLGAMAHEIGAALQGQGVRYVENPSWERGLSSSIRAGVDAVLAAESGASGGGAARRFDGAMLVLSDQPGVTREVLDAVVSRFEGGARDTIVACSYADTLGVPALFGRAHFDALRALEGDAGAKALLDAHVGAVRRVVFEAGALDVDTPEDYRALIARDPSVVPGRAGENGGEG